MIKMKKMQDRLRFYENSIDHLKIWFEENEELSLKITRWLKESADKLDLNQLKTVTQYHIEISKIMYASLALLDKVYRNKERFETWEKELEELQ